MCGLITPPKRSRRRGDYIIWQDGPEDGIGENAIMIESYSGVVAIQQNSSSININYETIDELCKLLKKIKNNG